MKKVFVRILQMFGEYQVGDEIEINEKRLDYLLSRKMVEQIDSITPKIEPSLDEEDTEMLEHFKEEMEAVFEQVENVCDQLGFKYEPGPKASEILKNLSEFLTLEPGSQPETEDPADIDPFETFLLERLDPPVVTNLLGKYQTAEQVANATEEELDELPLVGPATARTIKSAAEVYLGEV